MTLEWGTTVHESEPDAEFRARVMTGNEFTATYVQASTGEGADVFTDDDAVYITRTTDEDDEHAVVLSASLMSQLARDWLRYRGWPWVQEGE